MIEVFPRQIQHVSNIVKICRALPLNDFTDLHNYIAAYTPNKYIPISHKHIIQYKMYRLLSLLSILSSLLPPASASALRINNDIENDDTSYAQTTTPAVVATQFLVESTKSSTRRRHLAQYNNKKEKKRHDNKNHQHYEERMQKHEKRKEEKQKKKKKKKKKKHQLQQLDDTYSDKLLRTAVFDVGDEDEVESTFMTDYDETSTTDDYDDWDNNSGKNTITISFDDDWTISTTNETTTIEAIRSNDELRVNRMYTYGAPSIIKGSSSQYHLNKGCIPGLRIYNQDETITKCSWYNIGCQAGITKITNVDFASQINVKHGYHHPKMDTLVVRLVDGARVEYTISFCHRTSYTSTIEPYQWMPQSNLESNMIENTNHGVAQHYEPRLKHVPYSIRGPSLEYASVSVCLRHSSSNDIRNCINNYNQETQSQLSGVSSTGWDLFAYMKLESSGIINDIDQVYVLKNDRNGIDSRKCIIAFQGSDNVKDFMNFINSGNDETTYCGIERVHSGVSNELSKITRNSQYANTIKPTLETCYDVTCVGHSLGGALCNLFTMCANQDSLIGAQSWDEYNLLRWKKKV